MKLEPGETVYSRIADEISARGWTQGRFIDYGTGAVCLVGAVNCAYYGDPHGTGWTDDPDASLQTLSAIIGKVDYPIFAWNDMPGRTVAEVLSLLNEMHEEELADAT